MGTFFTVDSQNFFWVGKFIRFDLFARSYQKKKFQKAKFLFEFVNNVMFDLA